MIFPEVKKLICYLHLIVKELSRNTSTASPKHNLTSDGLTNFCGRLRKPKPESVTQPTR